MIDFLINILFVILSHSWFKNFVPQRRRTKKFYLALLRGHVKEDRVDIDIPIGEEADVMLIVKFNLQKVFFCKWTLYIRLQYSFFANELSILDCNIHDQHWQEKTNLLSNACAALISPTVTRWTFYFLTFCHNHCFCFIFWNFAIIIVFVLFSDTLPLSLFLFYFLTFFHHHCCCNAYSIKCLMTRQEQLEQGWSSFQGGNTRALQPQRYNPAKLNNHT